MIIKPALLIEGAGLYFLGAGIAKYLGITIEWGSLYLGIIWIFFLQLSMNTLLEYFTEKDKLAGRNRHPDNYPSEQRSNDDHLHSSTLLIAMVSMFSLAMVTVFLFLRGVNHFGVTFFMVISLALAMLFSIPPTRLSRSGFGELTLSVMLTIIFPAFAFIIQDEKIHRLLAMAGFPLLFFHFAMLIVFNFSTYAEDIRLGKKTFMTMVGWELGLLIHNIFIFSGYLLVAIALILGLPIAIGLPVILTLPLGLIQIWYLHRIAEGIKPNWQTLKVSSIFLFSMIAYLLVFAFWVR